MAHAASGAPQLVRVASSLPTSCSVPPRACRGNQTRYQVTRAPPWFVAPAYFAAPARARRPGLGNHCRRGSRRMGQL